MEGGASSPSDGWRSAASAEVREGAARVTIIVPLAGEGRSAVMSLCHLMRVLEIQEDTEEAWGTLRKLLFRHAGSPSEPRRVVEALRRNDEELWNEEHGDEPDPSPPLPSSISRSSPVAIPLRPRRSSGF